MTDEYCNNCTKGFPIPAFESKEDIIKSEIVFQFELINNTCLDCVIKPHSKQVKIKWHTECVIDFSAMINTHVVPGKTIPIIDSYNIINCENIKQENEIVIISFQSIELAIDAIIEINVTSKMCLNVCDNKNRCSNCMNGLWPSITVKDRREYEITVSSLSRVARILPLMFTVKLDECGYGSGILFTSSIVSCQQCQINQFKVGKGIGECYTCVDMDGLTCLGLYSINIKFNYWISGIDKYGKFIDLARITNNDSLFTQLCAPQMCCTKHEGCYYLNDTTLEISNNLCANGREYDSVLCSKCKTGQYELMGSSACGICNDFAFGYLTIVFFLSLLFTLYMFFMDSTNINITDYSTNEINWKRIFVKDENTALKIMVFRVIVYYFQSMSQLLTSVGTPHNLSSMLSIFGDFSVDFNFNSSSNGICIIPKLTQLDEIIWTLIFIYFVLFHSIVICAVIIVKRIRKKNVQSIQSITTSIEKNNTSNQNHISALSKVEKQNKNILIINKYRHKIIDYFYSKKPSILMALIRIFTIFSGSIVRSDS
eukprot:57487_1